MKLIYDEKEFRARTKPVSYHLDLDDIEPDTRLGFFLSNRYQELIEYCRKNPQYHIISRLRKSHVKVNHAVKGASFYMLAEGDPDPELMYSLSLSPKEYQDLQIYKF